MSSRSGDGSATVDKALDVLDAVGTSPGGLSQAELAARLHLPKTTLYRLLGTLTARGLLRRDPQRRVYGLGFRCFEYARQAHAMPDLAASASAELRMLRDLTGETTYLATLDGREVLSLDRCDGAHSQRSAAVLGQRKPLHCTSQGKAILAALPAARREALVRELALTAHTPRTITDRARLLAELRLVAARGYAVDDEEIVAGVRCCGAAIVDTAGEVRGAVSVAGPAFRLTLERVELLGPEVAQAARRIGAQLGSARAAAGEAAPEVVPGELAFEGAFPVWSPLRGQLYWADTLGPTLRAVHALEATPRDRRVALLDEPVGALLRERDATLVMHESGWLRVDDAGRQARVAGLPHRTVRCATADPQGRVWACTAEGSRWRIGPLSPEAGPAARAAPAASTWRLSSPATALAWAPDGSQLMAILPAEGTVLALVPGRAHPQRLTTIPKGSGRLSGLALDHAGGVWTALCDGWSVLRIAPDGAIDRVIGLPVPNPTDLAFAGPQESRLYVLSARTRMSMEALAAAPLSGHVFALTPGVRGVPGFEARC
ncbi:MAG: hypothetical protein RI988_2617 [Pseudomonadota bacterium]|jgi:DNA-binding IclR family transcriptional regulator/sugar lactone lactonase YvrE